MPELSVPDVSEMWWRFAWGDARPAGQLPLGNFFVIAFAIITEQAEHPPEYQVREQDTPLWPVNIVPNNILRLCLKGLRRRKTL